MRICSILLPVLASLTLHIAASAVSPPAPAPQNLPYAPYRDGDPLPVATLPAADERAPELPGPSYARRTLQPQLGLSMLPLMCAQQKASCKNYGATAGLALRPGPYFAWTLAFERTKLTRFAVHYLALGARVYALARGRFDPYLELGLGAEHWDHAPRLNLAFELSFGLGLHVSEHLQLAPSIKLRHGEYRQATCNEFGTACPTWSSMGERWLEAGLMLHFPLGQRH